MLHRARDLRLGKRAGEAVDCLPPVASPGDDLGDHRIVVDADSIAFADPGIDPETVRSIGEPKAVETAGLRRNPRPDPRRRAAPRRGRS